MKVNESIEYAILFDNFEDVSTTQLKEMAKELWNLKHKDKVRLIGAEKMRIQSKQQMSMMRWIFGTFILMVMTMIMLITLFIMIVMEDMGMW